MSAPTDNVNPETGIPYGVISANELDPELYFSLYDNETDLSWLQAREEIVKQLENEAEAIEDEVRIAIAEAGPFTEREYEHVWDQWVEAAYNRLGFDDRDGFIESKLENALEHLQIEEPVIEFDRDGVQGRIGWLGVTPLIWIFQSPVTGLYALCSPCVPGAGNLHQPDPDGVLTYDVPAHWRNEN